MSIIIINNDDNNNNNNKKKKKKKEKKKKKKNDKCNWVTELNLKESYNTSRLHLPQKNSVRPPVR